MKLLSIASDSVCGGATISLLNLFRGLKAKGSDIYVLIPRNGYLCHELEKAGIPYSVVPYQATVWPPLRNWNDSWKFVPRLLRFHCVNMLAKRRIGKIIRSFKPEIIHTNVSVLNIGYSLARKFGIPHLWHIREYGDKDFDLRPYPSRKTLTKRISQKSYAIAITRDLAQYYHLGERGRTIYNGICPKDGIRMNPHKKNWFLYVGLVSENKGATELIKAFTEFCRTDTTFRLLFLGRSDKKYMARLRKMIAGSPAENRIEFLGHRSDAERFMSEARAIIVPSRYEGFGRITAEAMFNGCLVIGRNTGGTKEQFDNGRIRTGHEIGLRYFSHSELVSALRCAGNMPPDQYACMVNDAQKTAAELYSNEQNIEKTYTFLEEIRLTNPTKQ